MWTSFNPPINFLERTKSTIYEDDLSLSISSVYLLTILWQLHDIPSWFSTEKQIQNALSAGWLSMFNWSTVAYTLSRFHVKPDFKKTVTPNRPLPSNSINQPWIFFPLLGLLSSSSLFLFFLSCDLCYTVIFELFGGKKKPAFRPYFTQMAADFVRFFFKTVG